MLKLIDMKIKIHKETLYLISLVVMAFAIAFSVVANLGVGACTVPALALSSKLSTVLPTTWDPMLRQIIGSQPFCELIIQSGLLMIFCIVIRRFRPFFLFSFVTTFIYAVILYGVQWIPAFWPEINHNYPLYLRIILLILSMVFTGVAVACSLKAYIYPPTLNFIQKGTIQHFNIKKVGIFYLLWDVTVMIISIFVIYAMHNDWQFWNYNLSYGTIISVFACGPLIGLFTAIFNKNLEIKTLFPKWEKAFEIEDKKGY